MRPGRRRSGCFPHLRSPRAKLGKPCYEWGRVSPPPDGRRLRGPAPRPGDPGVRPPRGHGLRDGDIALARPCRLPLLRARRPVSRCDGYRRARVTWSATCGARPFVSVEFWAARKGGGRPILIESDTAGEQLSGSASALVPPGSHLYATVTLECT